MGGFPVGMLEVISVGFQGPPNARSAIVARGGRFAFHDLSAGHGFGDDETEYGISFYVELAVLDGIADLLIDRGGKGRAIGITETMLVNQGKRRSHCLVDAIHRLPQGSIYRTFLSGILLQLLHRSGAFAMMVMILSTQRHLFRRSRYNENERDQCQ